MYKVKITVQGRVQGVGFRYFVLTIAREMGIFGRVWNNEDGTVGIHAQATTSDQLSKFITTVRKGPRHSPFAKVTYLDSILEPFPDYQDFKIKY
jgi:acylphosphatase